MGCLNANINLISNHFVLNISQKNDYCNIHLNLLSLDRLNIRFSVICTPNKDAFIRLSPDVLWFLSENDILDVNVVSNIEWIVK